MNSLDIILLVFLIIGVIGAGLYFLNKWAYKKMDERQTSIERSKMTISIYVIDKKKDKAENANLPKAVLEQIPKAYKFMKMYFVKAKVGPQIMTLMCDKDVFAAIQVKKNIKVDLAGMYIVNVKGMKSKKEMKQLAKAKKEKAKAEAKAEKKTVKV